MTADLSDVRAAFEHAMATMAPFERRPAIAVAVSGGADSLALALLAGTWARERGGTTVALTVDHGLRAESADEAAAVGRILAARGIDHRILLWQGAKPKTAIQATARSARYRLLEDWCRQAGVLHLLLGHQREDQAETFLMRLSRGSGPDGLSAMAPVSETAAVRRLRPLLDVGRAALESFLKTQGVAWIEDPSNGDPAFARVRLRQALPALAAAGADARALAAAAARFGQARAALEDATAALVARAVSLTPHGFAWLDRAAIASASVEIGLRALMRVLVVVGGKEGLPRRDAVAGLHGRLFGSVRDMPAATLGGCRLSVWRDRVLVCRETRGIRAVPVAAGARLLWDGRFLVEAGDAVPPGLQVGPFAAAGTAAALTRAERRDLASAVRPIPAPARATLPAAFDRSGLLAAPTLGYCRNSSQAAEIPRISLCPRQPFSAPRFFVAHVV